MDTRLIARAVGTVALALTISTSATAFSLTGSWANGALVVRVGDHRTSDKYRPMADRDEIIRFIRQEVQNHDDVTIATWQWKEFIRELRREIRRYRRQLDKATRPERKEIRELIEGYREMIRSLSRFVDSYRPSYERGLRVRARILNREHAHRIVDTILSGESFKW